MRRSARVKKIDRRRMEELREDVGVGEGRKRKLVRCRLKRAVHVERMEVVRLTKGTDAQGVEGKRRKRRPTLIWEDCARSDLVGVGGEWRMRARDRGEWRRLVETGLVMKKNGKKIASLRTTG